MLSSKRKEKTDAKWENGCGGKVCSVMQNGKMVWVGGVCMVRVMIIQAAGADSDLGIMELALR